MYQHENTVLSCVSTLSLLSQINIDIILQRIKLHIIEAALILEKLSQQN